MMSFFCLVFIRNICSCTIIAKEMTDMAIRDRGKIKWNPASFMPEGFAMTREMYKDQARQAKPLLDDYQTEEFDLRIKYAQEYKKAVRVTVWSDGFTEDYTGHIQRVDPITHEFLRLEVKPGEYERIQFGDVTAVKVVD
jgi:YolD-like protein